MAAIALVSAVTTEIDVMSCLFNAPTRVVVTAGSRLLIHLAMPPETLTYQLSHD